MKKITAMLAALMATTIFVNPVDAKPKQVDDRPTFQAYREGVRFAESVYPYDGGIFITNFGSEGMEPKPDENNGYIIYRKGDDLEFVVGGFHKPTGIIVKYGHLFVCDTTRLIVFDIKNPSGETQVIPFAPDDTVVNAITIDGDRLYVSVTNTGRIYSLDLSDPSKIGDPELWLEIAGPNGLAVANGVMYIATIPPDYQNITEDNVVYCVKNLKNPVAEKFYDVPGLYDGVAVSDNLKTVYVSDWYTGSITAIDIKTKKARVIYKEPGTGPADIAQANGMLYIPELPNSRIIELKVDK